MDRGLPAGELHDLGSALGGHQTVENLLDFLQRQIEAGAGVGKAQGALHVARRVDLDDAEAGVLLMVGAEATVIGAAVLDGGVERERDGAGLVESRGFGVQLGVAVDQRLELTVLRAALMQVDLVVAQEHLGINDPAALRTDAARELVEDIVHVPLRTRDGDGDRSRGCCASGLHEISL